MEWRIWAFQVSQREQRENPWLLLPMPEAWPSPAGPRSSLSYLPLAQSWELVRRQEAMTQRKEREWLRGLQRPISGVNSEEENGVH